MWFFIGFLVALVVGYALAPKANYTQSPGNVTAPTAEEGRDIAVLFGTRDIDGPNTVWFGHVRTEAIRR